MPNRTKEWYEEYKAKSDRAGKLPLFQKLEDDSRAVQADHRPTEEKVDGEGRSVYRVTITLLVSDRRSRDADGAISTILDTVLLAVGRRLNLDRGALRKLATSEKRRRGI